MICELERVSSLLEGEASDAIGFFDESRKRWEQEAAADFNANIRKGSEYLGAREDEEDKGAESWVRDQNILKMVFALMPVSQ